MHINFTNTICTRQTILFKSPLTYTGERYVFFLALVSVTVFFPFFRFLCLVFCVREDYSNRCHRKYCGVALDYASCLEAVKVVLFGEGEGREEGVRGKWGRRKRGSKGKKGKVRGGRKEEGMRKEWKLILCWKMVFVT